MQGVMLHAALCFALAPLLPAQGLQGTPGGLIKTVDPKVVAFEDQMLSALNELRQKQGAAPLQRDDKLRAFARREAELAATGAPDHAQFENRIKQQGLAPYGHRIQFGYGQDGKKALGDLLKDAALKKALLGELSRAAVGAFLVPEQPPYFQFTLLAVADPDPMAGKPGLSTAQTDPVVNAAMAKFKACYDDGLKRNPNLGGDVVVQVVIGATGGVDSAKLLRTIPDADFGNCALGVAQGLKFPAPYKGKPVTLNHPMRFAPPQGAGKRVGRLTEGQLRSGFARVTESFKQCYDARVKEKPGLAGTITLGVKIGADGAVTAVDVVHDEPADPPLTSCVLERAREVRFPIPEFQAPLEVTYPLRFDPPPPPPKG